jgi:RimJ/RimL family protein N-acetyltransferase
VILETERLRLRRLREDDRETVARWNADPVFAEHLGGAHSRAQSDEVFDRWQRHWDEHGFGSLGIEWAETGELIGRTGPAFHSVWPGDPEVGWAVERAWWGRGIATEAGAASIAWAFGDLGFARVASITTEANTASRRVMAKLGFRPLERVPSRWGELLVHVLDRGSSLRDGIEALETT